MNQTKEDKLLIANALDRYKKHKQSGMSTCTGFLDIRKLKIVTSYLNKEKIEYSVYKPYPFLEKSVIYFGEYEDFVTFYKVSINSEIRHSDILGTLFSLGIKEETIGDIIVEDGYFYYTNLTKMNSIIERDLVMIRNMPIKLERVEEIVLQKDHLIKSTYILSSNRIDNVVSKLAKTSRSDASDMIKDKLVLLNYEEVRNTSKEVKEDDILSIRRVGKFKIGNIKGLTKKDNIILEIYKYE